MAVEEGFIPAIAALAECWLKGIGCKADRNQAIELLYVGAEKGDACSQCELGKLLSEEGGEVLDDAIGFLKMSATQKYPEGMYQLAYHYYEGRGIYRDFNKARELCEELLGMDLRDKLREKVNALLALLTK